MTLLTQLSASKMYHLAKEVVERASRTFPMLRLVKSWNKACKYASNMDVSSSKIRAPHNMWKKRRLDVHEEPDYVGKLISGSGYGQSSNKLYDSTDTWLGTIVEERSSDNKVVKTDGEDHEDITLDSNSKSFLAGRKSATKDAMSDSGIENGSKHKHRTLTSQYMNASLHELSKAAKSSNDLWQSISPGTSVLCEDSFSNISNEAGSSLDQRRMAARNRWKRAAHSVKFINHMAANIRSASTVEEMLHHVRDDAGGVGAATFEGAKTAARFRPKGRKGMEGLLVRQDRDLLASFQDFYVAYLKVCPLNPNICFSLC